MSPLIRGFSGSRRQRGAIGLMAVVTFALAVLCMLLVIDSGRLYLEKRSLQRVADVSALEAATRAGQCSPTATAAAYAITAATRNGFTVTDATRTLTTDCGTLLVGANNLRTFSLDATQNQAIRVVVTHSVARSIAAGVVALFPGGVADPNITLSATAVAAKGLPPLASLTIRTTLPTVDSNKATALNALFGGLLGGNLNLSVEDWQGLSDSNINLLSYLNQLAIDTHVTAGDYTVLLSSNITPAQLLRTAATVLPQNGPSAQAAISGLASMQAIAGNTTVQLQNLLNLQTGTPTAGLNLNMNLFQLVEGEVQLVNSQSSLAANISANILGFGISSKVKIIEPPQLSAAGNPALATNNPTDPDQIYVRTAQIRTLISIDLSPLQTTLATASSALNFILLAFDSDIQLLPNPPTLDISLEAASADSHVIPGSRCDNLNDRTLNTFTTTAAVKLRVGHLDSTNWASSDKNLATPTELALLNIRTGHPRTDFSGGGLGILIGGTNSPAGTDGVFLGTQESFTFHNPAEIGQPPNEPYFELDSNNNIVESLQGTFNTLPIIVHPPQGGVLGALLTPVVNLVGALVPTLTGLIGNILGPLLDPLLSSILDNLGINLAQVDVGANLSCSAGQAALVI
jgi:uncharacterized membrane protein